jgi:hypothetical protein
MYDMNAIPLVDPRVDQTFAVAIDAANNLMLYRDASQGGRLITMDLGGGDVHFDAPLVSYATGYAVMQDLLIADKVMPIVPVEKQSDLFYQWDKDDAFQEVVAVVNAPGGNLTEISPRQSRTPFATLQYAVRTFLPTETEANADAALKLAMRYVQLPMDKLLISRELRVKRKVTDASKYATANKVTLAAGEKWNGGASSDPVANIHAMMEASLMPITHIAMSEKTYNAFVRNPAVQKYVASKTAIKPKPNAEHAGEFSALLELPEFIIGRQKYKSGASAYDYIWGGDVVLYHLPTTLPPMGRPIAFNTFRWTGGLGSGLNVKESALLGTTSTEGGWGVRTYFDPTRGAQGGRGCVVYHQDDEFVVDTNVAGLIIGAYQ